MTNEAAPGVAPSDAPLGTALVRRLREMVLSGAVSPGARMNEVRLAEELGTSRTPVRAALGVLAGEGLLDYAARRGFRVRTPALREADDAFELRAVLEGLAARQVAEQGGFPPECGARAEAALAEGDRLCAGRSFGPETVAAYRAMNVRFHEAVLAASGNLLLERALRLTLAMPIAALGHIPTFTRDELRRRHDDHHRVFDAIGQRDGWRAELLMREHVLRVRDAAGRGARRRG